MKKTTVAIGALALLNVVFAVSLHTIIQRQQDAEIRVDHLQDLRVDVESDGMLRARLGDSRARSAKTIAFTPRAALQFHHELGRIIILIMKSAESVQDQPKISDPL